MVTEIIKTEVIVPHPHQAECLDALEEVEKNGQNKALVVMATGLGKTILAALFVRNKFTNPLNRSCLFLCHQNDILSQAKRDFKRVLGDEVTYGFYHGEDKRGQGCNIVFASFQTLRENPTKFHPKEFDLIIVDETHHILASTYEKIIRYFNPSFLLGITATPDRLDGLDIREIYGKEVFSLPLSEALSRGLLSPVEYKLMTDEMVSLKKIDTDKGKMNMKLLNSLIFIPKRDEEIVNIIQNHMSELVSPRVMIFCSSIEHCERIAELISGAVPIHSEVPSAERKMRLELFRQGTFKVGVTVDMFNEALDIPETNLLVFLRTTSSFTIFTHQLGRGLRIHENKKKVTVLDFVGNCERVSMVCRLFREVREKRTNFFKDVPDSNFKPEFDSFFVADVDGCEFREKVIPLFELLETLRIIKFSKDEIIVQLQEEAKRLGVTKLTTRDIEASSKEGRTVGPSIIYSKFGNFANACKEAGLEYNNPKKFYSKEELISDLQTEAELLKRTPTFDDIVESSKAGRTAGTKKFCSTFGTFNDSLIAAGFEINRPASKEITIEYVLSQIKDEVKRLGRNPSLEDLKIAVDNGRLITFQTISRKFGGLENVLNIANIVLVENFEEKVPLGWISVHSLSDLCRKNYKVIKLFIEEFREEHPEWYKLFKNQKNQMSEYFHPDLVKITEVKFAPKIAT